MARKDLLRNLMADQRASPSPTPEASPARRDRGAIGAVSRSIEDLKTRSIVEVPAEQIDEAGIKDRIGEDADFETLTESLREYGQQVPVLLRHNSKNPERFEIVYGRRRVRALKVLGQPVKALIRHMDDRELVLAQGQENTQRRDLSFIEKAIFAAQMRDRGYDRKIIGDALNIDKTLISRMLAVADGVPIEVVQAIGPAPSAGRDRWLSLAQRIAGHSQEAVLEAIEGDSSDSRFESVLAAFGPKRPPPAKADPIKSGAVILGHVKRSSQATTVILDKDPQGFDEWLVNQLDKLHLQFRELQAEDAGETPAESQPKPRRHDNGKT